jgi:COMPASS component SPP1
MSSIDSLLNHDAAERRPSLSAQHYAQQTVFDAADALTTLATLGSGQQFVSTRELPSPTAFAHQPRRSSSFSSHQASVAPVEPEPPLDPALSHSPTLEQYHHASKSPEAKRRQSLLAYDSNAPILAPIQNLSADLQSQMHHGTTPGEDVAQSPTHVKTENLGQDVSQVVSPPPQSINGNVGRDETQDREPAFVRDEPTTAQIRETESMGTLAEPNHQLPSPLTAINNDPAAQATERQPSIISENMDVETRKAIEVAKQSDMGLRVKRTASIAESVTSPTESKPVPTKKRPAPSNSSSVKKKGMVTVKKPSKKRKLDTDGDANARSVTPSSRPTKSASSKSGKKGSQAGTPVAESSPAPTHSPQAHHSDDEGESSEDTTLYCICKKPDNHSWMIGCDGGCDDWFHGSCVNMVQTDEELVDKFICPLCEEKGRGQTTYKAMCRREECRKPARLTKGKESKYCSDECGEMFFAEQLQRTAGAKSAHSKSKKSKKKGVKNGEEAPAASDDDDEPTPLGGVLRAKDLKALLEPCKDIQAFKTLGSGVLSPPQTASPTRDTFHGADRPAEDLSLTTAETERLNALWKEKSQLKDRLEVLKDREKFVSMAKEQATRVAEREKVKAVKEFCGYDSRLSWSDAEFLRWRYSKHGCAAFQFSTLSPTPEQTNSVELVDGEDIHMADVEDAEIERVCTKKRCAKHPQWQKLNLQDARFEELEIAQSIKECEKEERSVRERARRRGAKDAMAKDLTAGDAGKVVRNREGWVEMV